MIERPRTKLAQRATRSSDVTRARTLGLAALGAALGAGIAIGAGGTPMGSERPLARRMRRRRSRARRAMRRRSPRRAKRRARPRPARQARSRPRRMQDLPRQDAACLGARSASCARGARRAHVRHVPSGARGRARGDVRRGRELRALGAGAEEKGRAGVGGGTVKVGATVPLVALASCAKCHDPTSARDRSRRVCPRRLRANADAGADGNERLARNVSLCFDEHRTVANAEGRLIAWEAAREAAGSTSWVGSARSSDRRSFRSRRAGGALALGVSSLLLEKRKAQAAGCRRR